MVAWMSRESVRLTLETGTTWFWSRSRQELWNKGATSGNVQRVIELRADCDADTLLALVDSPGPACHTATAPVSSTQSGRNNAIRRRDATANRRPTSSHYQIGDPYGSQNCNVQPGNIGETLEGLAVTIHARRDVSPQESYTARLLTDVEDELLKKLAEEASEIIMACKDRDHDHIRYEAGDLVYHLLVTLERYGISLDELAGELNARMK